VARLVHMKGLAEKAWVRGFSVVRLNQRNCGGTEHLTPGRGSGEHDGYWAEWEIVEFAQEMTRAEAEERKAGQEPAPTSPAGSTGCYASSRISSFANSGPFPASSCLKYTKMSRAPACCSRSRSAHPRRSSAV